MSSPDILSSDQFPLSELPLEIQWGILNRMDFLSLIRTCYQIPHHCPLNYFLHRLHYLDVPTEKFWDPLLETPYNPVISSIFPNRMAHESKTKARSTIERYIILLVYENKFWRDIETVGYIAIDPDMLFAESVEIHPIPGTDQAKAISHYGLEHFIGFIPAAIRAIDRRDIDFLMYLLSLYPSPQETDAIIGELFFERMKTNDAFLESPTLFRLLPQTGFVKGSSFYPVDPEEYRSYMDGVIGKPPPITIPEHQKYYDLAYMYGTIDGGQTERFIGRLPYIYERSGKIYKRVYVNGKPTMVGHDEMDMAHYVAMNGNPAMMEHMIKRNASKENIGIYLDFAIEGNNLIVADYLLRTYGNLILTEPPRSVRMVNLLKSYRIDVAPSKILIGAMISGNFDLLRLADLNIKIDLSEIYDAPCVMIRMLLSGIYKYPDLISLYDRAVNERDMYKVEMLLWLGYRPPEITPLNNLMNRELRHLFGVDLHMYPYISSSQIDLERGT